MSQFERDTAVRQLDDDRWESELQPGWRIGAVPNGGYVLAIAGRVLREALPHKDPLTTNAFYLAPTGPGPIECRVQILRSGRNTSHAEVKMYQLGELKVQVTAAYTTLDALSGESWSGVTQPKLPPWEECLGGDSDIEFRRQVDLRLAGDNEVFLGGNPTGSGEFCGWAQLADGSPPDVISLLMFADAFPPSAFSVFGPVGWVPTLDLSVQIRAHPTPGPLQCHMVTRHLTNGVLEEDGEYWDSSGQLVCLSRQTAKLRVTPAR